MRMYHLLAGAAVMHAFCPAVAHAIFNTSSPGIKKGIAEVESRNRYDADDRASKDGRMIHAVKMAYGFTDRFALELENDWQDAPDVGYGILATELEAKFRFYEPGECWLDFALKLAFEWNHEPDHAEVLKAKFLFSRKEGDVTFLQNTNFTKEIGTDAGTDTSVSASWQARYEITSYFQPGFEIYNSFGEISDMPDYNGQAHRIGPVFYGKIADGVTYQAGYLFGVSDAAEDGSFKLFIRYEFPL